MTDNTNNVVCFYNNGKFDKRAFTMMGLSAKSDDNAIGFFGTGFKYAIATLLRHGARVRVAANDNGKYTVYTFFTVRDVFRDKEHDFMYYSDGNNEYALPFTAHLGKNWKIWQAYRELYTNAIDEGGGVVLLEDDTVGAILERGDVCVYVTECSELVDVYHDRGKYFLNAPAVVEGYRMRAVAKQHESDNVIYYKTMYTGTKLDKETYFTYDYTKTVELTEDRTLADTWYLRSHIGELWVQNMSYEMLVEHLPKITSDKYYEYNIDAGWHDGSADFHRACAYLNKMERPMPMWARDVYTKQLPFDKQIDLYKPTRHQRVQLNKAIDILAHHKHLIDATSEKLVLCASLPNDVLGYYKDGVIYIAKEAFNRGFEKLLGTLYEEHLHMIEGCEDMSRAMQNILVDKCASLMEQVYDMEQVE